MRVPTLPCLLAGSAALLGCAHPAKPWRAATGTVTADDCAVYAALAPTLGDSRKYLLHPVTVPTRVPEQGFNNPDALPGFTMAEVTAMEARRQAAGEEALAITCDWKALRLPEGAFAWKSARSYDLAFGPVFRSTDGRYAVVDVSHTDTFSRSIRALRYVLGREGDDWRVAGYYSLPSPRVEIGPVTYEP